jgi:hypothetical protein
MLGEDPTSLRERHATPAGSSVQQWGSAYFEIGTQTSAFLLGPETR